VLTTGDYGLIIEREGQSQEAHIKRAKMLDDHAADKSEKVRG
jgi:hypothetical protein